MRTGLHQDRSSERDDQARLLGQGDEVGRRNDSALRMLPADEGLDRGEPAGLQIEDRLVVHGEALVGHRVPQLGHQLEPVGALVVEIRVEEVVAAVAPRLRGVHGEVGVAQQAVERDPGPGMRYSDARGDGEPASAHLEGDGECVQHALRDDGAAGGAVPGLGPFHEQGEFVATDSRHRFAASYAAA